MHPKSNLKKNKFSSFHRFFKWLLLGAFCHLGKFEFLESMSQDESFDTHVGRIQKKMSLPI
jgi:hypothetical protein